MSPNRLLRTGGYFMSTISWPEVRRRHFTAGQDLLATAMPILSRQLSPDRFDIHVLEPGALGILLIRVDVHVPTFRPTALPIGPSVLTGLEIVLDRERGIQRPEPYRGPPSLFQQPAQYRGAQH